MYLSINKWLNYVVDTDMSTPVFDLVFLSLFKFPANI